MSKDLHKTGNGKMRLGQSSFSNPYPYDDRTSPGRFHKTNLGDIIGMAKDTWPFLAGAFVIAASGYALVKGVIIPAHERALAIDKMNAANMVELTKFHDGGQDLIASAHIDGDGNFVGKDTPFAVQVGLYKQGKVKIFIAQGRHAGEQISIFPVNQNDKTTAGGAVVFSKIGRITPMTDARYPAKFNALSEKDVVIDQYPLAIPTETSMKKSLVSVPDYQDIQLKAYSRELEGEMPVIFSLNANPQDMGSFSIRLWNNDLYAVNLDEHRFYIKSTYFKIPSWKAGEVQSRYTVNGGHLHPHGGGPNVPALYQTPAASAP